MGIFDIFKKGLAKTRNFVAEGITKISASMGRFDEDMLDDLEALLVQADCGVGASLAIMDEVRESIKKTGDDSKEAVMRIVRGKMLEILGEKTPLTIEDNNYPDGRCKRHG